MASDDKDFHDELRSLLAEGRKIEAVKRYRDATGAGLAAAKDAVEALALERGEAKAEELGIHLISGECLLMFLQPVQSIHKWHRAFRTIFGKMPK